MSDFGQIEGMAVVLNHLDVFADGLRDRAMSAAGEIATLLESYAKTHHKWMPKTGATDVSTTGTVIDGGEVIDIYLSAGMDYDVFLELARSGKWAWLYPAIDANRDRILRILTKHLGNASAGGGGE